jgi:T-complex protein 1 subunit delta
LIAGGGAPEIHVSRLLTQHAQTLKGKEAYCFQAYAEALEVIPTTLAENAGLNPISIVTELRNKHAMGERNAGINVKKVGLFPLFSLGSSSSRLRDFHPLLVPVALAYSPSNDSCSCTWPVADI